MNEETGVEYLKPWQVNEVIYGLGGIGIIEKIPEKYSQSPKLAVGDIVMDKSLNWPWQTHFLVNPDNLEKVPEACLDHLPLIFSCLGLIGLTVLLGIREKGGLKSLKESSEKDPKKRIPITMVVSGAAGACGILAGQIGRLEGSRVRSRFQLQFCPSNISLVLVIAQTLERAILDKFIDLLVHFLSCISKYKQNCVKIPGFLNCPLYQI